MPANNKRRMELIYIVDTDTLKLQHDDMCTLIGLLTMVNNSKKANTNSIRLEKIVREQVLKDYEVLV
jgi:hypothetical protein